jgi:hypothetical protein
MRGGATVTGDVHGECQHTGPWNPASACRLTIGSIQGAIYTHEVTNDYFRNAADVRIEF